MNVAINDRKTASQLLQKWLLGSFFSGFLYGTEFTLFFNGDGGAAFQNHYLPISLEIHILSDWWFGDLEEWEQQVSQKGVGVEPCESLQAFELAKLRWSNGAFLKKVELENEHFVLTFENETVIVILLEVEDEYAFSVSEEGISEENAIWAVTCENNNYFCRMP